MSFDLSLTIAMPGTCGELIQGWSAEWDEAVLVSCPIRRYSLVRVQLCPQPNISTPEGSEHYCKVRRAARLWLNYMGRSDLGAQISVQSQLIPGRGMASSTADVVGTMAGLALALGYTPSPSELAQFACQIEPSDSIMFRGLALLAYRGSAQYHELGAAPALPLLMLDPGRGLDTLAYNAQLNLARLRQLAPATQTALDMLKQGLSCNDAAAIGAAATLSAGSYQIISDHPLLGPAKHWAKASGALGIVRAHSGGVVGLLYAAGTDLLEPAQWLARHFQGSITPTCLRGGGYLQVRN